VSQPRAARPRPKPRMPSTRPLAASLAATLIALAALAAAGPAGADPTAPPPVTILSASGNSDRGDIFITPTGDQTQYANGPEIIDRHGNVVWFHAIPAGQTASDFRVQTLDGHRVLSYWQGTGLGGLARG